MTILFPKDFTLSFLAAVHVYRMNPDLYCKQVFEHFASLQEQIPDIIERLQCRYPWGLGVEFGDQMSVLILFRAPAVDGQVQQFKGIYEPYLIRS